VVDRGSATRGVADLLPAKRAMMAKNPIVGHRGAALRRRKNPRFHRRVVEKAVAAAAAHSPFPECRLVALSVISLRRTIMLLLE
jgi:hypothetical protein